MVPSMTLMGLVAGVVAGRYRNAGLTAPFQIGALFPVWGWKERGRLTFRSSFEGKAWGYNDGPGGWQPIALFALYASRL